MNLRSILVVAAAAPLVTSCFSGGGGGGGAAPGGGTLQGQAAEAHLTEAIFIPNEGMLLQSPEEDPTVSIEASNSAPSGQGVQPGSMLSVSIPFNAQNGDVVGAGIRFGDSGPIRTVMIDTQGQTSGTLQFPMMIPSDICGDLSSICHDIKCYEYAVTSAGRVSRANINSIAVQCGNCSEPSCQDLLDDCELLPDPPDPGPNPTPGVGVVCSGAPVTCPNGASLDFCVDADTQQCWYEVGGRMVNCGDCSAVDPISSCVQQAVAACQ